MTKVTMTLLALATLAACEATTTVPADPMTQEFDRSAGGTNPGGQGPGETPWWGL